MSTISNIKNFRKELRIIAKGHRVELLGILNTTPDSFYDGGKNQSYKTAVESGLQMIRDGAFIIDIGGQSSRPGAPAISASEEWNRVEPVIKGILDSVPEAFISIDTYRSEVARKAVENGAVLVNDISAGSIDPHMFTTVASLNVPYVLMHMQGTPKNMQSSPQYDDVVNNVKEFFREKLSELDNLGVEDVVVDPGFGFGKTLEHNYTLLNRLEEFNEFGRTVLAGISRKSMIYKALDNTPKDALNGTTALNMASALKGAKLLRVHDIKEAREVSLLHNHLCNS